MNEQLAELPNTQTGSIGATLRLAANNGPRVLTTPSRPATELLSRTLAKLHDFDTPVVQIVQCSPDIPKAPLSRELALASLYWLGRTLLVSFASQADEHASEPEPEIAGSLGGLRRPFKDVAGVIRDVDLPDLYHARLSPGDFDAKPAIPPVVWLGDLRVEFRMMLLDCGILSTNPIAMGLVPRCHGVILTVCAGRTTLADIRATARQVDLSGGRLLGTVLYTGKPKSEDGFGSAAHEIVGTTAVF